MTACRRLLALWLAFSPLARAEGLAGLLSTEPRILWVAAHGDDETVVAPLLAHACVDRASACHWLVFTRAEASGCLHTSGCPGPMGAIREAETRQAARLYRATLTQREFPNGPFDPGAVETPEAARARWRGHGDPVTALLEVIERFRPDLILTLDPDHGFTGHPEHALAGWLAREAVSQLAGCGQGDPAARAAPPRLFFLLNHHAPVSWFVGRDPGPATERLALREPCAPATSCRTLWARATRPYRSQDSLMMGVRLSGPLTPAIAVRAWAGCGGGDAAAPAGESEAP